MFYNAAERRADRERQVHQDAIRLIERTSGECQRIIDGSRDLLMVVSETSDVRINDPQACTELFRRILPRNPQYRNFGMTDAHGRLICSAVPARPHTFLGDRGYIQRAIRNGTFAVGEYQIGRVTGRPSVNVAYPVRSSSGSVVGVVYAALDLQFLGRLTASLDLPPAAEFVIADRKGTIIVVEPPNPALIGRPFRSMPQGSTVFRMRSGVAELRDAHGKMRLYVFAPLTESAAGLEATVCVGVPRSVAFAEVDRVRVRNAVILLCVVALTAVAAYVSADVFVLKRIRVLVETTRRLSSGDLTARTGMGAHRDELGLLARSFDDMSMSLETAQQKLLDAERDRQRVYTEVIRAVTHGKFNLVAPGAIPEPPSVQADIEVRGEDDYTFVRRKIVEIARGLGMDHSNTTALVQAAGEAVTNALKHTTSGRCQIFAESDRLIVRVSDAGPGIRAEDLAATILLPGFSTKVSLGMGFTLMLALSDRVWLATGPGGTTVQLEKQLAPPPELDPAIEAAMARMT
jgi:anti-sigma regulatory factor (Ser/Thr protein kinase)/HAMP domain-containing protein